MALSTRVGVYLEDKLLNPRVVAEVRSPLRLAAGLLFCATLSLPAPCLMPRAQAQAAAPAAVHPIGTVKSIEGSTIVLTAEGGQTYTVTVAEGARVLQIAPGSKDLKSAQTIALSDIASGDRVLVTGQAGDTANAVSAMRVILMKSMDIASQHAAEQADWQRRGSGGIVSAVDAATQSVTLTSHGKKVAIQTSAATVFRRYASDSVKFEDASLGSFGQIQSGDQVSVRGNQSADGASLQAEEIVSGSFKNLAGTIVSVDAAAGTLTLKDLASKKTYTVKVTANANLRALPPQMAERFAARERGGQAGGQSAGTPAGGGPAHAPGSAGGSAGMDLSQMLSRMPAGSLQDLHPGAAVMLVASQTAASADALTAVTLLSGVEPILAATPAGSSPMVLSPWNVGGGAPEGGN
jgi:Domain of unknown function (DUF5666)